MNVIRNAADIADVADDAIAITIAVLYKCPLNIYLYSETSFFERK